VTTKPPIPTVDPRFFVDAPIVVPDFPQSPDDREVSEALRQLRINRLKLQIAGLETEAIRTYQALPAAERFFASRAIARIIDGANQAGKTLLMLMEVVRAFTGTDPYGKYPKKNCRIMLVGFDADHLSDPIWSKLTREGEFKLIRDRKTGKVRSVRPDPNDPKHVDPSDLVRKAEWFNSPPLLPSRYVRRVAYQSAGLGIPRLVEGHNGSRILFRSSKGPIRQGFQGHLIVFDEEIDKAEAWWNESVPRLMAQEGRFIWSATPLAGGIQLYDLREKADMGVDWVERFTLLLDDNPYISDQRKQIFRDSILDETELRARYYGEYIMLARRIYPTYDPMGKHGCEPFEIPPHWARYLVVDPGTRFCATLLAAVDPDEHHVWIYGGWIMSGSDSGLSADIWAEEVKRRSGGAVFEAFVIDQRMGRQHPPGAGKNVAEQYFEAAARVGLQPRSIGPMPYGGFWPGSDDVPARQQALMNWLTLRMSGSRVNEPVLKVMRGVFPELDQQIRFARTNDRGKRENQADEGREDAVQTLEYLAAFGPRYRRPPEDRVGVNHELVDRLNQKRRRQHQQSQGRRLGKFLTVGVS